MTKSSLDAFTEVHEIVKTIALVGVDDETYRLEVRRSLDPKVLQPYSTMCWVEVRDEADDARRWWRPVPATIMSAESAAEAESLALGGLGIHVRVQTRT